jgi:hypothetical protein
MRRFVWTAGIVLAGASLLTWFYTIHEQLPAFVRAPTSILLTFVAIASGLSSVFGWGEVYGDLTKVFFANLLEVVCVLVAILSVRRLFDARKAI